MTVIRRKQVVIQKQLDNRSTGPTYNRLFLELKGNLFDLRVEEQELRKLLYH